MLAIIYFRVTFKFNLKISLLYRYRILVSFQINLSPYLQRNLIKKSKLIKELKCLKGVFQTESKNP